MRVDKTFPTGGHTSIESTALGGSPGMKAETGHTLDRRHVPGHQTG